MLYYEKLFRGMYDCINEPDLPALSLGRTVELMRVRDAWPWPYMPPTVCAAFGRILRLGTLGDKNLARDAVAFAATCWLHVPMGQSPTVVHHLLGLSPEAELHPTRPRKAPRYAYLCVKCPHEHGRLKPLSGNVCLRPPMRMAHRHYSARSLKPLSGNVCLRP